METLSDAKFKLKYVSHLKHLKLKGLRPKTIDSYSRAIRRIGEYFGYQIDSLSETQLTDFFSQLLVDGSWSTVKLDHCGLKFYYEHVVRKPWVAPGLIKPPKGQRLPDIITIDLAGRIFAATRVLSYGVFYFTLYSLGLRLGEGLRLQVGDIDGVRGQVHIRDAKGNRDRLVRLPQAIHRLLRRFWLVHRNAVLLFPSRQDGLTNASQATTHRGAHGPRPEPTRRWSTTPCCAVAGKRCARSPATIGSYKARLAASRCCIPTPAGWTITRLCIC